MDDKYDLRSLFIGEDSLVHDLVTSGLEGTPLEDSSSNIAFGLGTFAVVNIVFLLLFFSQFAILWIERKAVARMNDRRGATTALRSLWVGETVSLAENGGTCSRSVSDVQLVQSTSG